MFRAWLQRLFDAPSSARKQVVGQVVGRLVELQKRTRARLLVVRKVRVMMRMGCWIVRGFWLDVTPRGVFERVSKKKRV